MQQNKVNLLDFNQKAMEDFLVSLGGKKVSCKANF